jgi:hypothetical protein
MRRSLSEVEAPQYLSVDMAALYGQLSGRDLPGVNVTKVTMQMLNEPTLELVSLAGKNPLHSELHAAIKDVAAPYSLRTELNSGEGRNRVNIDRHGNIWWFQVAEGRIAAALRFIDRLDEMQVFRRTRSRPLDRAESMEEE